MAKLNKEVVDQIVRMAAQIKYGSITLHFAENSEKVNLVYTENHQIPLQTADKK